MSATSDDRGAERTEPIAPPDAAESPSDAMRLADTRLLELLVCPITKTSLKYDKDRQELVSRAARLAFPIRDGVPLMTAEVARRLDEEG